MLFKIAFRNTFRQKRRSALTAISMAGGYVLMSLALSLSDGSYNHMIDLFTRDHTGHIQIHSEDFLRKPKIYKAIRDSEDLEAKLDSIPEIESYAPRIISAALAYGESKSLPVAVIGIDPEKEAGTSLLAKKIQAGDFLAGPADMDEETGYWKAMIGLGVADSLNLGIGDTLVLISQGADGSIANDIFLVSGLVGTKSSWEKMRVFIPIEAARDFLSLYGATHQYSLLLNTKKDARDVSSNISETLANKNYTVSPWQEVEEVFYKSMRSDVIGNYIMQGVIIFIVCIGILNTVLMTILERTREFGVLKAIGTEPYILFRLILIETGILATISCIGGFLVALPVNYWFAIEGIKLSVEMDVGGIIYDHILGEVTLRTLLLPAIVVISSAVFVSIFPAMRAAKISPIDALRAP